MIHKDGESLQEPGVDTRTAKERTSELNGVSNTNTDKVVAQGVAVNVNLREERREGVNVLDLAVPRLGSVSP